MAATFDRLPTPFMILDRDLAFVGMNQAYLEVTARTREQLLGRCIFDAFPAEGEPRRVLQESLERALNTGRTDVLPFLEYAIPRPESLGGGFDLRYWSATHTPLRGESGGWDYVIQHTQDVTELHRLRSQAAAATDSLDAPVIPEMLRRVEHAQHEMVQFRRLFDEAPGFMAVLRGPDHVFDWCNKAYTRLIGGRDVVGKTLLDALPEIGAQGFSDLLDSVVSTGEPFIGRAVRVMLQPGEGAPLEERFLDFIYQPIPGPDGRVEGVFVEGSDVTDATKALEQQRLLLDELNHRVKNTLATVQSIALQTMRPGRSVEEFNNDLQARLKALSHTHAALTDSRWRGASLRQMLSREFGPYDSRRIRLDGPEISVPPRMALTLGMVFHELATNAAKHGALAGPQGEIAVAWKVRPGLQGGPCLEVTWTESRGPIVTAPRRQGFGSRLIERSFTAELGGKAIIEYPPEGLRATLTAPLESFHE